MQALFNEDNRAETDRAVDIRAAREAELAPPEEEDGVELDAAPTRRKVISGGLASEVDS